MNIDSNRTAIEAARIRVTDHADEEMAADRLRLDEVIDSVRGGEIIEDYPRDHPLPSGLVYGQTETGDPIHSVWAYNEKTAGAILITVYRPDPDRWINWRTRKR
jgi:hypothetical protein